MSSDTEHLVSLLRVARCPTCDGSGVIMEGGGTIYVSREMAMDACDPSLEGSVYHHQEPQVYQCQWCDERQAAIAAHGVNLF